MKKRRSKRGENKLKDENEAKVLFERVMMKCCKVLYMNSCDEIRVCDANTTIITEPIIINITVIIGECTHFAFNEITVANKRCAVK